MYTITQMIDGMWCGTYQIQDGTEMFQESTRKKAIQRMVDCVRIMNGMDITEDDMEFGQEGISVTREEARMKTVDVLIDATDDLHLANLKLRKTLGDIVKMNHSLDCPAVDGGPDCCCPVGVAKEVLRKIPQ